jgi:predicted nucleic acid-binding Zn ribbon protein
MQRAGRLIGKLKQSGKLSSAMADPETRARAAWQVAAGKKIAEHTRPTTLVRSTLIVEVEDMVWQRQLNALRHFLLRNLTKTLGEELITEIDFRPAPKRRPVQRTETPAVINRTNADGISDPVLGLLYQESKKRGIA